MMEEGPQLTRLMFLAFSLGAGAGWVAFYYSSASRRRKAQDILQEYAELEGTMPRDKELKSQAYKHGLKMVLVVRTDLKMSKGKVAAQCCHAALDAYKKSKKGGSRAKQAVRLWEDIGQKKVTLKAESEEELLSLRRLALDKGLIAAVIQDAGKTEVEPGTYTVLAIGPDIENKVNEVTGELRLLH
uniref:peptidyl-tRNA hydrolase n=1 Tax=Caligus clemensi TaxID=344056 RepID=C1C2E2_CALCM|nr:Peptidyl-tRNA hydrolase 2, mitochondrial precursor [Caligus clemensi]